MQWRPISVNGGQYRLGTELRVAGLFACDIRQVVDIPRGSLVIIFERHADHV